jgi:hypothetical protein
MLEVQLQESNQQPEVTGKGKAPAGLTQKEPHKEAADSRGSWARPPDGWIKVNVDASFVGATGCAGAGVVAEIVKEGRNSLLGVRSSTLFNCAGAAEAEALACVEGTRLATQWCRSSDYPGIGLCSCDSGDDVATT